MQGQLQPHCPSSTNVNFCLFLLEIPLRWCTGLILPPQGCSELLPFPVAAGGDVNAGGALRAVGEVPLGHACPTRRPRRADEQMLGDGLGAKSDAGVLGWVPTLPPSSRAVGEVSRKAGDCLTSSSARLNCAELIRASGGCQVCCTDGLHAMG